MIYIGHDDGYVGGTYRNVKDKNKCRVKMVKIQYLIY